MNHTIKTYSDLCAERDRLKGLLIVQKQRVADDWEALKDEFQPVQHAIGVIGKMAKPDGHHPLINTGLKVASDLFIRNFVLGKAGWLVKLAVPFVMKNYSSHVIADKGKNFIGKVSKFLKGRKKDNNGTGYPSDSTDPMYS